MDDHPMEEYLKHIEEGGDLSAFRWLKSRRLFNAYSMRRLTKALQMAESEGKVRKFKVTKPFVDGRTDVWWAWERVDVGEDRSMNGNDEQNRIWRNEAYAGTKAISDLYDELNRVRRALDEEQRRMGDTIIRQHKEGATVSDLAYLWDLSWDHVRAICGITKGKR